MVPQLTMVLYLTGQQIHLHETHAESKTQVSVVMFREGQDNSLHP